MRLTLQNGYPYPLPPGFDFDAYNPHGGADAGQGCDFDTHRRETWR